MDDVLSFGRRYLFLTEKKYQPVYEYLELFLNLLV